MAQKKRLNTRSNKVKSGNKTDSRKQIFIVAAVVLVVGALGVTFRHSSFATPQQLCTNDRFNGCWRDSNNSDAHDNPVVIANKCSGDCPAQGIRLIDMNTTYRGYEVYNIKFSAHSLCIASMNNDEFVEMRDCNAHGTAWARLANGYWMNRGASEDKNTPLYACADEVNGYQVTICPYPTTVAEQFFIQ